MCIVQFTQLLILLGLLGSFSFAAAVGKAPFPFQQAVSLPWDPSVIHNEQCKKDVEYWLASIEQYISWSTITCAANDTQCTTLKQQAVQDNTFAIKQIDSFGRIPADILDSTIRWQGSYEECVNIKGAANYQAQFCWIGVVPGFSLTGSDASGQLSCDSTAQIEWSVCMPRSCQNEDVKAFMDTLGNATDGTINFCQVNCRSMDVPKKNAWFYIVTIYSAIALALIVIASTVDYIAEKGERGDYSWLRRKTGMPALLTFSMFTNGAEILSTAKRSGQIDCLHCMRAVSMSWVLVGHVLQTYLNADNPLGEMQLVQKFLNDVFINALPSVDSFFFIGGVLLAYLFYKEMDRNPRTLKSPVYWTLYYVHRIIRLSVPYFAFIGFFVIVYPYYTKGPFDAGTVDNCKKYWWRNLLYIQNFFSINDSCLGHTWYLSTDMFQHIFAPLLLVPLCLSLIAGGISAVLLLGMTIGATYGAYFKYNLPATITGMLTAADPNTANNWFLYVYTAPWVRCSPVIIGVFTGYFLHKMHSRRLRLHWLLVTALWVAATAIAVACIYGMYDPLRGKKTLNTFQGASYYAFHRIGWAVSLSWVVIACHFNMAGPIKNFMELGFWAPFSRLTYCAYLTHIPFMDVILGQERTVLHFVNTTEAYIHGAIPVFVVTYVFSFVWSCAFEVPFAKLEKMATSALLGKGRPKQKIKEKLDEETTKKDAWGTNDIAPSNVYANWPKGQIKL